MNRPNNIRIDLNKMVLGRRNKFSVKLFRQNYLNKAERPCNEDADYVFQQCVDSFFANRLARNEFLKWNEYQSWDFIVVPWVKEIHSFRVK